MEKIVLQNLDEIPEGDYIVQQDTSLTVVVYASGKKSVEGKTHVHLAGKNSVANIYGIFVNCEDHKIMLHTLQHHEAEATTSNLLVKSVLIDSAAFLYDGAIRVEKSGQKTDAYQRNENLSLSHTAHVQSKPSLEILADDVRCTHGATIGSVDAEQLFYLASRGISTQQGENLIVQGFLESVLTKIPDTIKVEKVRETVWQSLSKRFH